MSTNSDTPRRAGALDIRNVIGGLLLVYGLILTGMGIFGDKELDKTGGINANLWAGLALLVVGGLFIVWTLVRPIVVPPLSGEDDRD